jgi:hypothetical protein
MKKVGVFVSDKGGAARRKSRREGRKGAIFTRTAIGGLEPHSTVAKKRNLVFYSFSREAIL